MKLNDRYPPKAKFFKQLALAPIYFFENLIPLNGVTGLPQLPLPAAFIFIFISVRYYFAEKQNPPIQPYQFLWSTVVVTVIIYFIVAKHKREESNTQLHFALVKEYVHCNQHDYYCTKRYSSFGGLRSFLFSNHAYNTSNFFNIIKSDTNCSYSIGASLPPFSLQTAQEIENRIFRNLYSSSFQQDQKTAKVNHLKSTTSTGKINDHQQSRHKYRDYHSKYHRNLVNNLFLQKSCHQSKQKRISKSALSHHFTSDSKMVKQNPETSSTGSVSSKEAENLISFLAFQGTNSEPYEEAKEITKTPVLLPPVSTKIERNESNLEPATLIYHESARSIVFRDHLRRSYSDTQDGGNGNVAATPPTKQAGAFHPISEDDENLPDHTEFQKLSLSRTSQDDETMKSNGSESKKSNTSHSSLNHLKKNHRKESLSFADSQHSASSVDSSIQNDNEDKHSTKPQIIIANYTPVIEPLPAMELGAYNEFNDLLESKPFFWEENEGPEKAQINLEVWDTMTQEERDVTTMLLHQKCVVKTVKKADWTSFLQHFLVEGGISRRYLHPSEFKSCSKEERYKKYSVSGQNMPFNSFMTSTTLLPATGLKMRCYGSTKEYCLGVIFPLPTEFPDHGNDEDAAAKSSNTWSWPSGYAAKTEFNISTSGDLINGRDEALVSFSSLRSMNHTYIYEQDYEILGRMVKGGLKKVPYNEIYLRVGGRERNSGTKTSPLSFNDGVGLPIALFVRSAAYGDLIALMRTKRRMTNILGKDQTKNIPLLYITPEHGVHVITDAMQAKLLHRMTNSLNPFQNPSLQYNTEIDNTSEEHLHQKLEELFDLDDEKIREILTPEECARLAGGFGATDNSVAHLLMDAMIKDFETETEKNACNHNLQNLVNEGLTSAVRSGDYNTSRQLLILYTLVASRGQQERDRAKSLDISEALKTENQNKVTDDPTSPNSSDQKKRLSRGFSKRSSSVMSDTSSSQVISSQTQTAIQTNALQAPPPPPPLDTDRLRSATNSDGLLAVLGAAEVLKSMQKEAAKKRALEAIDAVEEWIDKSENSVTYRLAHWRDLTAAQGDLKIATEEKSHLWHFVSNKAIHNRRHFVNQLKESVAETNFESITFLKSIHDMVSTMHSPCLRLELLQFILGLDNRYSVAHVARSVELAATCLNISAYEATFANITDTDEIYSPKN